MAQFAQPTSDENLIPGWSVQGGGVGQSTSGIPGAGYGSTPANVTTSLAAGAGGQLGSGVPQPQGALNIGAEASGSQTVAILTNNGYSNATGAANRVLPATIGGVALTAPTMTTGVAATNPSTALAALVSNSIPADVTGTLTIKNNAGVTVQTLTGAALTAANGVYTVPPGGTITATFSGGTWTWAV